MKDTEFLSCAHVLAGAEPVAMAMVEGRGECSVCWVCKACRDHVRALLRAEPVNGGERPAGELR